MHYYVKVGKVPPEGHTTFYKPDGKSLYREELFSTKGFNSKYSPKYHIYMLPQVETIKEHAMNNSSVDSDEVIYYVYGGFMSRTGVMEGSVTLHPIRILHGPQPGKIEASIGKKETEE